MTPQEAKDRYDLEWVPLNAEKEAAVAADDVLLARKCRQALSALSAKYSLRFQLLNKVAAPVLPGKWQPMNTAPTDRPILGWCIHSADPYWVHPDGSRLTIYGGHCEGASHVKDGPHVLEWGGSWDDRSYEDANAGWMPDWWFLHGSEFEIAANPVAWMPIRDFEWEDMR